MDKRWSEFSQRAEMMDATRRTRFTPLVLGRLAEFAQDFAGERYLEIGCGPGALLRALAARYPDKSFVGLDLDDGFIEYAKAQAGELENLSFCVGDAYALPFEDESMDGTLSHTVLEHVEPGPFYAEQLRVLNPGGQCLVLSIFPGASLVSAEPCPRTEEEEALQAEKDRVYGICGSLEAHTLGIHAQKPHRIPRSMAEAGFIHVHMDFQAVSVSRQPNDGRAAELLEAEEINELSYGAAVDAMEAEWARTHPGYVRTWTPEKQERLAACIKERYDRERARMADTWTVNARMMMVLRGQKPFAPCAKQ